MENLKFLTLAAVRAQDPEKFSQDISAAVYAAAKDVGDEVVINALCAHVPQADFKTKAA